VVDAFISDLGGAVADHGRARGGGLAYGGVVES
jgi:hypothetical protein